MDKNISPHSLQHPFITAASDAGVALRDEGCVTAIHRDQRTNTSSLPVMCA